MTSSAAEPERPSQRPRVLIIEDHEAAAEYLKNLLEERGCECVALIHKHTHEFEAEFDRMYPHDEPVLPEFSFQGTILDVIFHKSGATMETEGGRDLYKYLQGKNNPRVLDHLGIVLVVSEHGNPKGAFEEIGASVGPNLRFSVKINARILGSKLDAFVADLMVAVENGI